MNIKIRRKNIKQIRHFNYLGTTIGGTGKQNLDIKERIEKTIKSYNMFKQKFISNKKISKKTEMTVFKTIFRPISTYDYESWLLRNRIKQNTKDENEIFKSSGRNISTR